MGRIFLSNHVFEYQACSAGQAHSGIQEIADKTRSRHREIRQAYIVFQLFQIVIERFGHAEADAQLFAEAFYLAQFKKVGAALADVGRFSGFARQWSLRKRGDFTKMLWV